MSSEIYKQLGICPPYNWDEYMDRKEQSLYYHLLVKQEGKKRADFIWNNRQENRDDEGNFWKQVKDYKPKNKLNLIGDLAWGFNKINGNNQ